MPRKSRAFLSFDMVIAAMILAATAAVYLTIARQLDYAVAYSDAMRIARLACESQLARLRADGAAAPDENAPPIVQVRDGTTLEWRTTAGDGQWTNMVRVDVRATRPISDRKVEVRLSAYLPLEEARP
ncbi:MAG: hypothetical protein ACKVS9_09430 [Phycisphaerae bacterium]